MKIVQISGPQGSGKTTLSDVLMDYLSKRGFIVKQFKYADTIYQMHNAVLKILEEKGIKRDIVKDGNLLQLLGTDWGRETIDNDIWVKCCLNEIREFYLKLSAPSQVKFVAIIDDTRFENEFNANPDSLRVRLKCDRDIRKKRCSFWRENENHPSETGLDRYEELGYFDKIYDTGVDRPFHIATLIAAQLDKKCWIEKRDENNMGVNNGISREKIQ